MSQFLYRHICAVATEDPERVALIDGGRIITYEEFRKEILNFCHALQKLNLNADSKLGILCVNQSEFLVGHIAALTLGLPLVPSQRHDDSRNAVLYRQRFGHQYSASGRRVHPARKLCRFLIYSNTKFWRARSRKILRFSNSQAYNAFLGVWQGS